MPSSTGDYCTAGAVKLIPIKNYEINTRHWRYRSAGCSCSTRYTATLLNVPAILKLTSMRSTFAKHPLHSPSTHPQHLIAPCQSPRRTPKRHLNPRQPRLSKRPPPGFQRRLRSMGKHRRLHHRREKRIILRNPRL